MYEKIVKWMLDSGVLDQILGSVKEKETPLTAYQVRGILDEYIVHLMARMDEDRLRQLAGGLSQLRDSSQSTAGEMLVTHALDNFHEIAALPQQGRTGDFDNFQLISLAYLGMAAAYQLLGDSKYLIAEKIIMAVNADPDTVEGFLGKKFTNSIYRQISPNIFFQLAGSIKAQRARFPSNIMYFIHPKSRDYEHLWVKERVGPITGAVSYRVGITHFSAQLIGDSLITFGHKFPKKGSKVKHMKRCGDLEALFEKVVLYAPLSGKVIAVNDEFAYGITNPSILAQDPYVCGWLFQILPNYDKLNRLENEFNNLLSADNYRKLIEEQSLREIANIESIEYITEGDRDLYLDITLVDELGEPVIGAAIKGRVKSDRLIWNFEGDTNSKGTLSLVIENTPHDIYETIIEQIDAREMIWAGSVATPNNQFRK